MATEPSDRANAAPRCPRTLVVRIPRFNPPAEWSPNWRGHHLQRWDAGRAAKDLAHWCAAVALDLGRLRREVGDGG